MLVEQCPSASANSQGGKSLQKESKYLINIYILAIKIINKPEKFF
jgi:hypothetical protein